MDGQNWRDDFQLTLHIQDQVRITRPTGNIFLTNIHRVYAGDDIPPSPDDDNTMEYFLGKRPTGATTDSKVDLGMIVRDIDELVVAPVGRLPKKYSILDPDIRWFPADEALRDTSMDKLLPPLVSELRKQVKAWREKSYTGATDTSRSLLNWWFNTPHLQEQGDGTMAEFQYYFAQREAVENWDARPSRW